MFRRSMRGTAAGAAAVAIAALTLAAPGSALAAPPSPDGGAAGSGSAASPAMLKALQRDLGIADPQQARARLGREKAAAARLTALRGELVDAYAGGWLTGNADRLVVGVTTKAAAAKVRAAGAEAKIVARNEQQLDGAKAALDKAAGRVGSARLAGVTGWYVDVAGNRVVVTALPAAVDAAKAFAAAAGVTADVVASADAPRPLFDVRGGDAYYIGGGRCSIGFSVNGGFVTAGHCGNRGNATSGFNRVSQGRFEDSSFPGNDYAWVSTNSDWTPRGVVNDYNGGEATVAGSAEAATNASICRSGSTTGWHCGTIQAKNQTVNYPQGTVFGLTRTNVCAEPGDSGGSWLSGDQAQGVTSGGSGNCSSGGTTFYQPVNEILSVYGLTLVTDGGGNPPPEGCDGYEATYNGTLSSPGVSQYQPDGSWYFSDANGSHQACLRGPGGTDFDLYLQKWNGSGWTTVARAEGVTSDETIDYGGTTGYYRYRVRAYSGSGDYTLAINTP